MPPGVGEPADDAARHARRAAVFGDDEPGASVDERDDADRARDGAADGPEHWYREQRPPHHGG